MQLCTLLESLTVTSEEGGKLQQWRGESAAVAAAPRPVCPREASRSDTPSEQLEDRTLPQRRPLPALQAAPGCVHAQLLHGRGVCAPRPASPTPSPVAP